jgi:hypothetical protein
MTMMMNIRTFTPICLSFSLIHGPTIFMLHFVVFCSYCFFGKFLRFFFPSLLFSPCVLLFQVLFCWLLCIIYKESKINQLCWFLFYCFFLVFYFFKFYCVGFLCRYLHGTLCLLLKCGFAKLVNARNHEGKHYYHQKVPIPNPLSWDIDKCKTKEKHTRA